MEEKKFKKKKGPDGIRTRDLRCYFRKFESRYNRNDPPLPESSSIMQTCLSYRYNIKIKTT